MRHFLLFFVFGCGLLFVACENKPKEERTRLFGDFELLSLTSPNGHHYEGLLRNGQIIISPEQDSIKWNMRLNGFMVYTENGVNVYNRDGKPYLSGNFDSVTKAGPYVKFINELGIYLCDKRYQKFVGPLQEYTIIDHFIFAKRKGLWGLYTTDLKQITEERYGILFVANAKSMSNLKLIACRGGNWYAFDATGKMLSEDNERICRIVTSRNMPKNIGIISRDVKF